jgi:hypothetical protein
MAPRKSETYRDFIVPEIYNKKTRKTEKDVVSLRLAVSLQYGSRRQLLDEKLDKEEGPGPTHDYGEAWKDFLKWSIDGKYFHNEIMEKGKRVKFDVERLKRFITNTRKSWRELNSLPSGSGAITDPDKARFWEVMNGFKSS